MPIDYSDGYFKVDTSNLRGGVLDRPGKFAKDITAGLINAPLEIAYDFGSVGASIYNTLNHRDAKDIELMDSYWDAIEAVEGIKASNTTKTTSQLTALLSTTTAAASRLAKIPKVSKLLQSSKGWDKVKAGFYTGGIGGAGADLIHTNKDDGSLFELIPEKARPTVLNWFVDRADDSELEGVIKNALEGLAFGTGLDLSIQAVAKVFKSSKSLAKQASGTGDEYNENVDQLLGTGDGSVANAMKENTLIDELSVESDDIYRMSSGIPDSDPENALKKKAKKQFGGNQVHVSKKKRQRKKDLKKLADTPSGWKSGDDVFAKEKAELNPEELTKMHEATYTIANNADKLEDSLLDILTDPNADGLLKDKAKVISKYTSANRLTRNNVKTTGDAGYKDTVGVLEALKQFESDILIGKVKEVTEKARTKTTQVERTYELIQDLTTESGKWSKQLDDMVFKHGYDKDTVVSNLLNYTSLNTDIDKVFIAFKSYRTSSARNVLEEAKKVDFASPDLNKQLTALSERLVDLDSLDQILGGAKATVGRLLSSFKQTGSSVDGLLREQADLSKKLRAKKAAGKKLTPEESAVLDTPTISKNLTDKDKAKLELFVDELKRTANPEDVSLKKLQTDLDAVDLFESYYRGSLLSGVRTVTGSVFLGNTAATVWKQIVEPTFLGLLDRVRRGTSADSHVSDGLMNAMSLVTSTIQGVKTFFNRDSTKGLESVMTILDSTAREGAEVSTATGDSAFISKHLKVLAEQWKENGAYTKATMAELMNPLVSKVMGIQNFAIRRISDTDRFFKGLNNNTSLLNEARRAYRRHGDDSMYFDSTDKVDFMQQYMSKMNAYIDINYDKSLTGLEKTEAVEKLFKKDSDALRDSIAGSVARTLDIGKEATLQSDVSDLWLGRVMGALDEVARQAGPLGRMASVMIMPFRKTPAVIMKEVADHSPFAIFIPRNFAILRDPNADRLDKLRVVAKMVSGISMSIGLVGLAASGKISGSIMPNEREKAKAMGIKEHSVLIGDTWYSYESLGPIATLISASADYMNTSYRDPDTNLLTLLGMSMTVASQDGHMRTFRDLMDLFMGHEDAGTAITSFSLNKVASAVVPMQGLIRSVGDSIDGGVYRTAIDPEIEGFAQQFKFIAANAFKSNSAFTALTNAVGSDLYEQDFDVLGDNVFKASDDFVGRTLHLLGVGNTSAKNEPYIVELARHGLIPSNTRSSTIGTIPLTANEFKNMRRSMFKGELNVAWELNNLVTSDLYKDASLSDRKRLLQKAVNTSSKAVKEGVWATNDRLRGEAAVKDAFNLTRDSLIEKATYESMDYYLDSRHAATRRDPNNIVTLQHFKGAYGL